MAAVPQPAGTRDPKLHAIGAPAGASVAARAIVPAWLPRIASRIGMTLLSVGLFCGLWELLWALGISDARLLPPPHVFLGNFPEQAKFFNTAQRWQVGVGLNSGPSPAMAVLITHKYVHRRDGVSIFMMSTASGAVMKMIPA